MNIVPLAAAIGKKGTAKSIRRGGGKNPRKEKRGPGEQPSGRTGREKTSTSTGKKAQPPTRNGGGDPTRKGRKRGEISAPGRITMDRDSSQVSNSSKKTLGPVDGRKGKKQTKNEVGSALGTREPNRKKGTIQETE